MAMTAAQEAAFKTASGNLEPSGMHLLCPGLLIGFIFLRRLGHRRRLVGLVQGSR